MCVYVCAERRYASVEEMLSVYAAHAGRHDLREGLRAAEVGISQKRLAVHRQNRQFMGRPRQRWVMCPVSPRCEYVFRKPAGLVPSWEEEQKTDEKRLRRNYYDFKMTPRRCAMCPKKRGGGLIFYINWSQTFYKFLYFSNKTTRTTVRGVTVIPFECPPPFAGLCWHGEEIIRDRLARLSTPVSSLLTVCGFPLL